MNEVAHNRIMAAAVAALPERMRVALDPVADLIGIVGNYPDIFDNPTRTDAERDADDPNWRRFTRFPPELGGTTIHFWPATIFEQQKHRPMLHYLLSHAVEAFRAGELDAGTKFIGCLSHYIGDVCQPIHTVDEQLIAELLPRPASMPDFHYHADVEAVTGVCGALQEPVLLGLSIDEAVWRLGNWNLASIIACRPYVVPTIQALFAGDLVEAERLAGPPLTRSAQGTADIFYTALVLAEDGAGSTLEREALSTVDLRHWRPDAEEHASAYGGAIVDGGRATPPAGAPIQPASLLIDGKPANVRGLGVLPTNGAVEPKGCWMRFSLPVGVFERFVTLAGMDPELTDDGAVEFIVELDGSEVFRSGRRTGRDEAIPISVPLNSAGEIRLRVEEATSGRTYFDNHVVWGEPRLVKRTETER